MIGALLWVLLARRERRRGGCQAAEEARRRAYLAGDYTAVASMLADDLFLTKLTRLSGAP